MIPETYRDEGGRLVSGPTLVQAKGRDKPQGGRGWVFGLVSIPLAIGMAVGILAGYSLPKGDPERPFNVLYADYVVSRISEDECFPVHFARIAPSEAEAIGAAKVAAAGSGAISEYTTVARFPTPGAPASTRLFIAVSLGCVPLAPPGGA